MFRGVGAFVEACLIPWLELEVLDRIGQVDLASADAGLVQQLAMELPGGPDERLALDILLRARLLPDEHQRRTRRSRTEHGLGRGRQMGHALHSRARRRSADRLPAGTSSTPSARRTRGTVEAFTPQAEGSAAARQA